MEQQSATWQVRKEAFKYENPDWDPLKEMREPQDGDSIWMIDYKQADNDTRMLMIGDKLNDIWNMLDHVEQHLPCNHEHEEETP